MNIRSKVVIGAVAGLIAAAAGAGAANATPVGFPVDVVAHTDFTSAQSMFEANIPGCATGTVTDAAGGSKFTPWGGRYVGMKDFVCDGGAGGFTVKLTARFGEYGSVGSWTIADSWGAFDGIKGSGKLTGTPTDIGVDDRYTGTAH